jgi:predicted RNA-binding Zn-ribbon protein involved in translation (DUF1610 family)
MKCEHCGKEIQLFIIDLRRKISREEALKLHKKFHSSCPECGKKIDWDAKFRKLERDIKKN